MIGAGKSTLAEYIGQRFAAVGRKVEVLDFDELAEPLVKKGPHTKDERELINKRLGLLCRLLTRNDVVAIVASVSPLRDTRDQVRREVGRFVEVWVDCPTEKLIERDTTGLYKKALAGEIPNFTGVTDPYETPQHAEVILKTDVESVDESANRVLQALVDIGYLKPEDTKAMIGKRIRPTPPKARARAKAAAARRPAAKRPVLKVRTAKRPQAAKVAKAKPAKGKKGRR
jgi:adenylylsulfate kinase